MIRALKTLAIIYLVLLVLVAGLMRSSLNDHWFLTFVLFAPRWVAFLPLVILFPWTWLYHKRLALGYLVHAAIIVFFLLDYQLPLNKPKSVAAEWTLNVLSCNVGGGELDMDGIVQLIEERQIDVLLLQECNHSKAEPLFEKLNWNRQQAPHIVIASPLELGELDVLAWQPADDHKVAAAIGCQLSWPEKESCYLASIHLPTFRPALERLQNFDTELGPDSISEQGDIYRSVVEELANQINEINVPILIGGDFNVPCESVFFTDYWDGFQNSFNLAGTGFGYTKYTRFHGIRIDHVLADQRWTILDCEIGPDLGGDHRPVIVQLARDLAL